MVGRIKLLGICGSPRKRGNSNYLLECVIRGAVAAAPDLVDVQTFSLAGKQIAPCIACDRCSKTGECATEDDFQELRDKWHAADAIIYSVPVYNMAIPAQLKAFIDRLGNSMVYASGGAEAIDAKNLKVVGVAVQGGCLFAGQEQIMSYLINHAVLMSCLPVSGDEWQSYLGAAGWTRNLLRKDSLRRLHEEGDLDAQATVAAAESLGKRVVQVAMIVQAGGMAYRDMLVEDGNFGPFLRRLPSSEL
jgi:multimeric flavodoxin WrbA